MQAGGSVSEASWSGIKMKRCTITLGASTTAGGKVVVASATGSINGAAIALEGDAVFCPACKSTGKIVCVAPRIPELWSGKQVALQDDICVCGCPLPPRLVPNQTLRFQNTGAATETSEKKGDSPAASAESVAQPRFDDHFLLIDEETGEAMNSTEYCIKRASGRLEFGTTDHEGRTHMLSAEAKAESVEIYA